MRLNEDCYGAKVSDLTVTMGEDDFANFSVGSEVVVNFDGKDHIRKVRDFPEDIGIVVKGYPVYYSDFNFISTEDFDDWYSKDKFTESAIDYSSMFDNKSKDIFHKGDFDKYKISDEELEDMMDDQTDLEECWQMLATMYEDIWNDVDKKDAPELAFIWTEETGKSVVDLILKTPIYWKEGFIKNDKGAMLGSTKLESKGRGLGHPVVYISTVTDELDDGEFYNVLLHEMCHVASYYAYGSLDGEHNKGWKKYADKCNSKIEFLKGNELMPTCDTSTFEELA